MSVIKVTVSDFRNLSLQTLSLNSGLNVFVGQNAQGKTNFLEAVFLLGCGKSFRTAEYRDLISWEKQTAQISADLSSTDGRDSVKVFLHRDRKEIFINDKKASWLKKPLLTVLFAPEEILMLKGSPAGRRQYVDDLISKLSPVYAKALKNYHRVLVQRNRLLKEQEDSRKLEAELPIWDAPLIELGGGLILERKRWIEKLNSLLARQYDSVAAEGSMAQLIYQPQVENDAGVFQERLLERRALEKVLHRTLTGPHRDDFQACLGARGVKPFGSQGEARTFTLALKLAEIDLIQEVHQKTPVLLLDDVISELDPSRNEHLFKTLETFAGQMLVTTTDLQLLPGQARQKAKIFEVSRGSALYF